jgi:hypothetical protein
VASGETWDRSAARAVVDLAAVRDNDSAIDRNGGLGRAAGTAAAQRNAVAAAVQADNYAAPDNSVAPAVGSFFVAASHNSVAGVIDSCAAQNNCVPA